MMCRSSIAAGCTCPQPAATPRATANKAGHCSDGAGAPHANAGRAPGSRLQRRGPPSRPGWPCGPQSPPRHHAAVKVGQCASWGRDQACEGQDAELSAAARRAAPPRLTVNSTNMGTWSGCRPPGASREGGTPAHRGSSVDAHRRCVAEEPPPYHAPSLTGGQPIGVPIEAAPELWAAPFLTLTRCKRC